MAITRQLVRAVAAVAFSALLLPCATRAQFVGSPVSNGTLNNLSVIKPPAGSKVAIVVFEDLGCPACAHAHPIEQQVAASRHVPLLRYDFPLQAHVWTFQGAVCARYIQKHFSPQLADQFRTDVFLAQSSISSKDDIQRYMQTWLKRHGKSAPFTIDADGSLAKLVQSDYDLGRSIHLRYTPTVLVVSADKQQVVCGKSDDDTIDNLASVVTAAQTMTSGHTAPHHN